MASTVQRRINRPAPARPRFLDFFAGAGLVTEALKSMFEPVWANDICSKKAAVYCANHGSDHFVLGPIEEVNGAVLPDAELSWASFPCQDLSLAGTLEGITGKRSGLVWRWLRVMDDMRRLPPIVVVENVVGLVSAESGAHYRTLHRALTDRGYLVGAVVLDAALWTPQSRPRVFVVGVDKTILLDGLVSDGPEEWLHPSAVSRAALGLPGWIWWRLPPPPPRTKNFEDVIEWSAACDDNAASSRNIRLIKREHLEVFRRSKLSVAPGYKRTRNGRQVLELRFDGLAGCLRTPEGGSSRQVLVLKDRSGKLRTRLLTVREAARLMGLRESYSIPGSYNDGYRAMGDGVAAPVARHLARRLLLELAARAMEADNAPRRARAAA